MNCDTVSLRPNLWILSRAHLVRKRECAETLKLKSGGVRVNFQVRSQPRQTIRQRRSPFPKAKVIDDADDNTMSGFLTGSFSSGDDIDFDRAASAFPDISLDGSGNIPTPTIGTGAAPVISHQTSSSSYADFDDFVTPPPHNDVNVTGDDEFEQFQSQFPDIGVPVVSTEYNAQILC